MTPKEKAKELYYKFLFEKSESISCSGAELFAFISVDEIIKECYNWNGSDNVQWETKRFEYWQEVKQ